MAKPARVRRSTSSKLYEVTITTNRGVIVMRPRPAARRQHREQLRRPRTAGLLRRPHVPPGRAGVRDPGRMPRGQRPRRSRLQVRRRAGESGVRARRGRDGELRSRTPTARSSSSASTTASASSTSSTTCSVTSTSGIEVAQATEVGDVMKSVVVEPKSSKVLERSSERRSAPALSATQQVDRVDEAVAPAHDPVELTEDERVEDHADEEDRDHRRHDAAVVVEVAVGVEHLTECVRARRPRRSAHRRAGCATRTTTPA